MRDINEVRAKRPGNRANIERHKTLMLTEVRAYKLAELRREHEITQEQLAAALHVRQSRVSAIERGEMASVQVDTLKGYIEALGGEIEIVAKFGEQRIIVA